MTTAPSTPNAPRVFADAATLCGESPLWDAEGGSPTRGQMYELRAIAADLVDRPRRR